MATFSSLQHKTGIEKFQRNLYQLRTDLIEYHYPFSGDFLKKTLDAIQYLEDRMLDDTIITGTHIENHRL